MNPDVLDRLDMARVYGNVKFKINSAIRCNQHNKDVAGTEGSAHLSGFAVDIATPDSHARYQVLYGLIKAGFNRLGIYKTFIHADDDPYKTANVVWYSD